MSIVAEPQSAADGAVEETTVITSWKVPIILAVAALVALVVFVINRRPGDLSTFRLSRGSDTVQLPEVVVPTAVGSIVLTVLLVALAVYAATFVMRKLRVPLWLPILFTVLFFFDFIVWAAAGQ